MHHLIVGACVALSLYLLIAYEVRERRRLREHATLCQELADRIYEASEVVSSYRTMMERHCCFHQLRCPARGEQRILPMLARLAERLIATTFPNDESAMLAKHASETMLAELDLWKRAEVRPADVDELLKLAHDEDAASTKEDEPKRATPVKPRGRPKKEQPLPLQS